MRPWHVTVGVIKVNAAGERASFSTRICDRLEWLDDGSRLSAQKKRRPYLQYLTAGDTRVRPEHEAWDQTVLLIDDPWWNSHYPPNGWGCRCTVRTLNQRQLERTGLAVDPAPPIKSNERINTRTGEVYGDVPEGIDTGFDFNVGKAWLAPETAFGEAIAQLPPPVRSAALSSVATVAEERLAGPFATWAKRVVDSETAGSQVTVGYLSDSVFSFFDSRRDGPASATITILDSHLRRMRRDLKRRIGKALPDDVLMDIPARLVRPAAVLFDKRKKNAVYVTEIDGFERLGKLVVEVGFTRRGQATNAVVSGAWFQSRTFGTSLNMM